MGKFLWSSTGALALFLMTIPASAALKNFTATLTGGQVVPPVATNATGTATLQIDDNPSSRKITGTITFTGLTVTNKSHIVGGGQCGFSAPTGGELLASPSGNTITVDFSPSIVQYGQILGGGGYVSLSSAAHPGGEIRGQLYEVGSGTTCAGADAGPPPATPDAGGPSGTPSDPSSPGSSGASGGASGASGADAGPTSSASGDDGGCSSTNQGTSPGLFVLLGVGLGFVIRARRRRRS